MAGMPAGGCSSLAKAALRDAVDWAAGDASAEGKAFPALSLVLVGGVGTEEETGASGTLAAAFTGGFSVSASIVIFISPAGLIPE